MKPVKLIVSEFLEEVMNKYREKYGSIGRATTITMTRYNVIMEYERNALRNAFTRDEIALLKAINGLSCSLFWGVPERIAGAAIADVQFADDDLVESFGVNRSVMIVKLCALNLGQQYALIDWLEEI